MSYHLIYVPWCNGVYSGVGQSVPPPLKFHGNASLLKFNELRGKRVKRWEKEGNGGKEGEKGKNINNFPDFGPLYRIPDFPLHPSNLISKNVPVCFFIY